MVWSLLRLLVLLWGRWGWGLLLLLMMMMMMPERGIGSG